MGLTRDELGSVMGCSGYSVQMYETGVRGIPPGMVPIVCEYLDVKPEDLVSDWVYEGPVYPRPKKKKKETDHAC